jgi:hypothetical protein
MSSPWDCFHIKFIPSPYLKPLLAFYLGREMKWLAAMALRPQSFNLYPIGIGLRWLMLL